MNHLDDYDVIVVGAGHAGIEAAHAAAMLEAGEISKEDYDKWRYHYPEVDKTQNYVKVPPQDLF